MTRFIQFHILTSYPPANLNRDDTGRPKTAIFGGHPRLRISSQSLKRAWRTSDVFGQKLKGHLAERTRRLGSEVIISHLTDKGCEKEKAEKIATDLASVFGKADDEPGKIKQLAFISPEEKKDILAMADQMLENSDLKVEPKNILRKTDKAADLAMFGRMLADNPAYNREASVQVSHAISTHRVTVEDDYYTAVDDLNRNEEDAGAGFLGVQEFGAGVFYIYVCVDYDLLKKNLDNDTALANSALSALVESASKVAPKGKQNSFASHAYASYILAESGTRQPRSLAAAFLKPIYSQGERDETCLIGKSINAIENFRGKIDTVYGQSWDHDYKVNAIEGIGSFEELTAFASQGDSQ